MIDYTENFTNCAIVLFTSTVKPRKVLTKNIHLIKNLQRSFSSFVHVIFQSHISLSFIIDYFKKICKLYLIHRIYVSLQFGLRELSEVYSRLETESKSQRPIFLFYSLDFYIKNLHEKPSTFWIQISVTANFVSASNLETTLDFHSFTEI